MKNSNLFLLASLLFAMVSCGTLTQQGMYGTTQFRNSIYYSPKTQQSAVYAQQPAQQYVEQQPVQQSVAAGNVYAEGNVQTLYVGEENQIDVQYTPGTTYVIADDYDSYAARLRKFDSPVYTVNIVFDDPYPWWGVDYAWGSWRWSPWGWDSWRWNSWRWGYSSWDRWYWYNTWHSPWYAGSYWDWYWGDPWWRHHHHRPVYHPAPPKGPSHARPGQKVYYGKRDSSPSYRNGNMAGVSTGKGSPMGKQPQGSVTRRPSDTRYNQANPQQQGAKPQVQQQGGQTPQKGQNTQYRRTEQKKENVKSTGNTSSENKRSSSGSQYNRGNSSSSSSNYRSGSSYNPGRSSHSYSSGSSSSRSGGSSSSYRRR